MSDGDYIYGRSGTPAGAKGRDIHDSFEHLRRMIDEGRLLYDEPPRWAGADAFASYLATIPAPKVEPIGQTYKGIPIYAALDVKAGHMEDTVFVIDRASLRSVTIEPKSYDDFAKAFGPAGGYRTFEMQRELYDRLLHEEEEEWRALKRRSEDALHRAINGRTFSGRWWRDLRDSIVLGFKADWSKTVHPDRMVPKPMRSYGMITGLT